MKHKKLIALLAASVMAMSSMSVCAETIEGDVNYVNQTIYKVVLPTTSGMSFTLDPQGLASLDKEGNTYDAGEAGKIISTGTMTAENMSSVDVVLNADFYLVDSDSADPVDLVTSITETEGKQATKEIVLTVKTSDTTTTSVNVTSSTAGAGTNFTMAAATYTFKGNKTDGYKYEMTDGTGKKLNMTLEGSVAKDYDWSAYTGADPETLTLNAVFKFTKTAGGDAVVNTETTPATDDFVMAADDDVVSYTFVDAPEGTLTKIFVNDIERTGQVTKGNITYTDGTLTFNAEAISVTGIGATGSYTIKATIGSETVTLTYTK